MTMTSNKPYLLRAFYEWIVDNELTPYILVDASVPGTQVPHEYVKDGQIVLNISPSACGKMEMNNVDVCFEARFGGAARRLVVPCGAILAIYAKENGAGTVFTVEDEAEFEAEASTPPETPEPPPKPKGRPNLTVVK